MIEQRTTRTWACVCLVIWLASLGIAWGQVGEESLADVIARVDRSVVSVIALQPSQAEPVVQEGAETQRTIGTGFFLSPTDVVSTTDVVAGRSVFYVVTSTGARYRAALVGGDLLSRTALLRIAEPVGQPVSLETTAEPQRGDEVFVLGNSYGMPGVVSRGIICAVERTLSTAGLPSVSDAFQVSAEVHPGGAGSPVFDLRGHLLGLVAVSAWPREDRSPGGPIEVENLLVASTTAQPAGAARSVVYPLTFCLPADTIAFAATQLAQHGVVRRGRIGVTVVPTPREVTAYLGLPEFGSCTIARVSDGSPAAEAGLQEHDVIVALEGKDLTGGTREFLRELQVRPGRAVALTVIRQGKPLEVRVKLGESVTPLQPLPGPPAVVAAETGWMGIVVAPVSEALAAQAGVAREAGVVVLWTQPDGPAARAGIRRGDLILRPGKPEGPAIQALSAEVGQIRPGSSVPLQIRRLDGEPRTFSATVELGSMPDQVLPAGLALGGEAYLL